MAKTAAIDQLLDLLIEAIEERKTGKIETEIETETEIESVVETKENDKVEGQDDFDQSQIPVKIRLPKSWLPWAAAHNIYNAHDITPAFIESLVQADPSPIKAMKLDHIHAMSDQALAALPDKIVWSLPYRHRLLIQKRLGAKTPIQASVSELAAAPVAEGVAENEVAEGGISGETTPQTNHPTIQPTPTVSDHLPQTLIKLFLGLIVVVLLANINIDYAAINARIGAAGNKGTTRVRPVGDGTLMRGNNSKEVYVIEDGKRRWITTSEAFTAYGYRWGSVRKVSPDYLSQFEEGKPIELVVKCPYSPHIFVYTLEEKGSTQHIRRYIADIDTFSAEGYVWADVHPEYCDTISRVPAGPPIPISYDGFIPGPKLRQ